MRRSDDHRHRAAPTEAAPRARAKSAAEVPATRARSRWDCRSRAPARYLRACVNVAATWWMSIEDMSSTSSAAVIGRMRRVGELARKLCVTREPIREMLMSSKRHERGACHPNQRGPLLIACAKAWSLDTGSGDVDDLRCVRGHVHDGYVCVGEPWPAFCVGVRGWLRIGKQLRLFGRDVAVWGCRGDLVACGAEALPRYRVW